jgi:thiamine-phosphate kinase
MNEKELIRIIKSTLNSEYIGDDCAYLPDLGIVITQDSLVEDIHFKTNFITPFQLGYKTVMVNISDVCASGAEPKYLTLSLSLPKYIDENFVKDFYEGAKIAAENVKIVGGDLTGSDKIYISAAAIGSTKGRKISSRSHAKAGYKIIVSGEHGSSAYGLKLLLNGENFPKHFIKAHLMPVAQRELSRQIAENAQEDYAMMDTSDGLADALMQIAKASNTVLYIDTSKIPHASCIDMNTVLYGGEDYQLVAAVPETLLKNLNGYTIIGEVKNGETGLVIDGKFYTDIEGKLYNHFKE